MLTSAAVLCCGAVLGQAHCGTSYTYAQSYQYPSYHYGYAQTYQYPAYNYNYNYQYQKPYHDVIQFVAVEDPYEAALVGARKRAELTAEAKIRPEAELTATVAKLADAVARLEQRAAQPYTIPASYPGPEGVPTPQISEPLPLPTKGQPYAAPEPPYAAPPAPAKTPPPNALPPLNSTPPPSPERPVGFSSPGGRRLNDKALRVLTVNCAKCHTGSSAKKGFRIFEDNGALAALDPVDLLRIDQAVYSGSMPPARPLDEESYSDLRAGINEFGPEITALLRQARTTR
jgi:mono/diheme cytochrome c family protein